MSRNILKLPSAATPETAKRKGDVKKALQKLRQQIAENGTASLSVPVGITDPDLMAKKHAARMEAKQRL